METAKIIEEKDDEHAQNHLKSVLDNNGISSTRERSRQRKEGEKRERTLLLPELDTKLL